MTTHVDQARQPRNGGAWRGVKTIRWDDRTRELIWSTTEDLIAAGMSRPPIRAVLYRLLDRPGWTKRHYQTLTSELGKWRDAGLVPYGAYSDESGGRARPYTAAEIETEILNWQETEPARLPRDGILRALLVEHEALVQQIEEWTDGRVLVVSSAGQIRRENLWSAVQEWRLMAGELGAREIHVSSLVDWDRGGDRIFDAHARWFRKLEHLDLHPFGLTRDQLDRFGLDPAEDWQIDGVIGLDVSWWRDQIRDLLLP